MDKEYHKNPRGKMLSYALFLCKLAGRSVRTTQTLQSTSQCSKKCSHRRKTTFANEKVKFEDMAKVDKACYEREMKTHIPFKGEMKKKFRDPNASKRSFSALLFCSDYHPKIKESILTYSWVIIQRSQERCGITLLQMMGSHMKRRPII